MTNYIYHNFESYNIISSRALFHSICDEHNCFDCLHKDLQCYIFQFLIPIELKDKKIKIFYEIKNRKTYDTNITHIVLSYYDFVFQLTKALYYKYNYEYSQHSIILPYLRNDIIFFKRNHVFQVNFPIHFDFISQHKLSWFRLFIEIVYDFSNKNKYNCLYYEKPMELNEKYITLLKTYL